MLIATRTRSRSSVHFIDEIDEPHHRHTSRSPSRHSSVEEVIASRPRSYSRRHRPIYLDGAADTQPNDARCNLGGGEETGDSTNKEEYTGSPEPLGNYKASRCRRSPSSAFVNVQTPVTFKEAHLALKSSLSASTTSSNVSHLAQYAKDSQDHNRSSDKTEATSDAADSSNLNDRARVAFADYGYEIDSQFPSPPSVNFAVPAHRQPQSLSPLRIPILHVSRKFLHDAHDLRDMGICSPIHSSKREFYTGPRQSSYDCLFHDIDPFSSQESNQDPETPPTSLTSSMQRPAAIEPVTITADDPGHPDHFAYLLSSAQIVPTSDPKRDKEPQQEKVGQPSYESQSVTPLKSRDPTCYEYAMAGSTVSSLDGRVEEAERSSETEVNLVTADSVASIIEDSAEKVNEEIYYHERSPWCKNPSTQHIR